MLIPTLDFTAIYTDLVPSLLLFYTMGVFSLPEVSEVGGSTAIPKYQCQPLPRLEDKDLGKGLVLSVKDLNRMADIQLRT